MIKEFQGEYRWLSNFSPVSIILDGNEYPSVEHAYMSAKSDDNSWKLFCSNKNNKPGDVKRMSKNIRLIGDWNNIKLNIMRDCIEQKFEQEPYRTKLLKTGNEYIQEGNMWNDKYWGFCLKTNKGENNLGKLIMVMHDKLKEEEYDN